MNIIDGLIIATGILDFALSFIVLVRNNKNQVNISFAIFSFFLGAWAFGIAFFRIVDDPLFTLFWAKDIYIAGSCIAASLFYFALIFPEGKPLSSKKKALVIIPSVIHATLLAIPWYLTTEIVNRDWGREVILGKFEYLIFSIYFISFFYGALYILWRKYRTYTGILKKQILFILSSILLAGFIASIFDLFLPWFGNYQLIYVGPATSGVIFWLITYAIVRHQLWDFRLVVVRSIVYSLLILWITSIYTIAVFWISRFFFQGQINNTQSIIYAILAIFVAFTVQPIKRFIEQVTDQIFFKNKYDSQALLARLTKVMATTLQLQELTSRTLHDLLSTVHISRGTFLIFQQNDMYAPISEGFESDQQFPFEKVFAFSKKQKITLLDEEQDDSIKQAMRDLNVVVVLPLYSSNKLHGLLMLGEKKSGEIYSNQDTEFLTIFGAEIAVALENAKSYEEIKRFNITLRSEIDKATKDLKNANSRLQELDKLKDEFVSLASHELRTPMTAINSYISLLMENNNLDEKGKRYLQHAFEATTRLINLVNDMLNVSRIESGRLVIRMASVDIKQLIQDVINEIMPAVQKQGLTLKFEIPEESFPRVQVDSDKIKEVIINLVGNSIKFTSPGGQITIKLSHLDGMIAISVSDTGRGIKAEDMQKLFKKFGLIERTYAPGQTRQGTGLGLYINKNIVEMHGGTIKAYSEGENKGSTFTFMLPPYFYQAPIKTPESVQTDQPAAM